jgi:hypothetical protein
MKRQMTNPRARQNQLRNRECGFSNCRVRPANTLTPSSQDAILPGRNLVFSVKAKGRLPWQREMQTGQLYAEL